QLLDQHLSLVEDPVAFWGEGILAAPANGAQREMLELLIRRGARVPDVSKWGPQYYFKHTEIGRFLLEQGMNPNHHNWHHFTLLHHFAAKGSREKVLLLLEFGADLNAIDEEYRSTPLACAARWGQHEIV